MNEISRDELFEGLLGYGLFAEKLPPIFTSKSFYDYCKKVIASGNSLPTDGGHSDYIRYDSMRNVCVPRALAIPNPISYARFCKNLSDNWSNLQGYFKTITSNQPYKVSRIHIRKMQNSSALFEMNYKNQTYDGDERDDIIGCSKYRVVADISSCFPSIYTHTIPWAIKGKNASKASGNHWSDEIDTFCRETKYNETSGILIGPHASNIISEIILCKIDEALVSEGFTHYSRNIDDYSCYVSSMEEAERFLLCLNKYLKEYELSINHKKTRIIQLPETAESDWKYKLNSFYFGAEYTDSNQQIIRLKMLRLYIDLALSLTIENNDAAPLSYAIKVLSSKYLGVQAVQYYVKRLIHIVFSFPYLAPLLDKFVFEPFSVDKAIIREYINIMYKYGQMHNVYEASSYALFWAIKYNIAFDSAPADDVIKSKDCIFMLMSFVC